MARTRAGSLIKEAAVREVSAEGLRPRKPRRDWKGLLQKGLEADGALELKRGTDFDEDPNLFRNSLHSAARAHGVTVRTSVRGDYVVFVVERD